MMRQRLPDRRESETFEFDCAGLRYVATVSRFPNHSLAEIFLTATKAGSQADVAARDSAVAASLAMQYGADAETIRKALCRDGSGGASGPLARALDIVALEP